MAQQVYKLERIFTTRDDEMLWLVLLNSNDVIAQGVEELSEVIKFKIIEKYGTDDFKIMSYYGYGEFFEVKIKTSKYNSPIFFNKCPQ